jgi:hypothetical protein
LNGKETSANVANIEGFLLPEEVSGITRSSTETCMLLNEQGIHRCITTYFRSAVNIVAMDMVLQLAVPLLGCWGSISLSE